MYCIVSQTQKIYGISSIERCASLLSLILYKVNSGEIESALSLRFVLLLLFYK